MNATTSNPLEVKILFYAGFLVAFPLILVGNCLVILSIVVNRRLRTATNALLFSLSLADLPVGVLVFPLISITQKYGPTMDPTVGLNLCHVSIFVTQVFLSSSCLHLLFISADRYIAITKPLRYHALVTSTRIGQIITFTWILSLFAALLPFTGWRQITNRTEGGFCQYHLNLDITYILFLHVTVCVVPITVTCAAYCQIFLVARRQAKKIANTEINVSERERQQRRLEKERKITFTVAVVLGVFILCWGPLNVLLLVYAVCHSCASSSAVEGVEVFAMINSACNPIIYSVLNKDFRQTFKQLLCCQYGRCHSNSVINSSNNRSREQTDNQTTMHVTTSPPPPQ